MFLPKNGDCLRRASCQLHLDRAAGSLLRHYRCWYKTTNHCLCSVSNVPEMLELHFAVPMTGAVLNTINTRLDAKTIATILDHGESQMLFVEGICGCCRGSIGDV